MHLKCIFFYKKFVRACVYKNYFVPLHAFYVYGGLDSTYRSGAEHGRTNGARGDYPSQRLLGMQGQVDVYVRGRKKQRDGRDYARAAQGR